MANRVTWLSVIVNTILTVGKLFAGILGHSAAMVADAIHSASDFMTDFAVLLGMRLATRPQDEDHPYGHGKYETLTAVLIGLVLVGVGVMIIFQAGHTLYHAITDEIYPKRPSFIALWAGIVSLIVKEILYQSTANIARQTENEALLANAWHHRSDALSSIGTSLGAGAAAILGGKWVLLDPVAAIFVGIILARVAWGIIAESMDKLMEHGMSVRENAQILTLVHSVKGLSEPHHLRSRRVGTVAVIELHFRVDPEMTVYESHEIACQVELHLRRVFGQDAIVTIHVEPTKPSVTLS